MEYKKPIVTILRSSTGAFLGAYPANAVELSSETEKQSKQSAYDQTGICVTTTFIDRDNRKSN